MKRDPFYNQLIGGLAGSLDPDVFERCAVELLREIWPTIVPIRGGSDSGMDGAIADAQGEPYPLIVTTGRDVLGNLTRSIDRYISEGGNRRNIVLATSQSLTPRRRKNLERRSVSKGMVLIQVYEQAAMANLLYHRPEWCKELLSLTGRPSALSLVPLSTRQLFDAPLIGRAENLAWLSDVTGDKVLTGVPGSGKTFLLREYAKECDALFLVDSDRGEIASAIRSQKPITIIVDDAHYKPDLLAMLVQLRKEIGAEFDVLVSSWPVEQEIVVRSLAATTQTVRLLDRLTRDEIVEVIHGAGIGGPVELIREIVDQSDGRPGLAVTLSYLCIQGGVQEVALGDALSRETCGVFERVVR